MVFNENLISFKNAKQMLDAFVDKGGYVSNLKKGDREYDYIKNLKAFDENGNYIDLETRFALLNHPRAKKYSSNVKQSLINEINNYLSKGGSFHVTRKKLPFFERLNTYTRQLRKTDPNITNEQVMKDLGFNEYSDLYYRCMGLNNLKNYRDEFGYVDNYRTNSKMKAYIQDLSKTLNLPYYIVITLICNEKLKKCSIFTEYFEFVKQQLVNHYEIYGTLKGLKRQDNSLYEKFNTLIKYYSDGTENKFTKEDWLYLFGLEEAEHGFKDSKSTLIEIDSIMFELKQKFGQNQIKLKDLDRKTYRKIVRKAVALGVAVDEVFTMYGLNYNGIKIDRLSKVFINKVPYLNVMLKRRDELLQKVDTKNLCKEEIFEKRVEICKIVYEEFESKIYNYSSGVLEEQLSQ